MKTKGVQNAYHMGTTCTIIVGGLVLAMMLLGGGLQRVAAEETIRLTNGDWPPYYGEQLPHYGFDSHIVTEAFALKGVKVEYEFFPWARALNLAKLGTSFDGSVGWGDGPKYQKDFYISDTTSEYYVMFFHRKGVPFDWETPADLKGMRIGLTIEYDYPDWLNDMVKNGAIEADWAPNEESNFRKLLHGRIDLYPADKFVGLSIMKRIFTPEEMAQITYHETNINQDELHVVLSKQNPDNQRLITLFNEGLQELKDSGRYDEILEAASQGAYNPE